MTEDGTLGIGDLAALTGVPVRTIRFYCDEGVIEAGRSAGGHRRFDASAVDRLRLVRRLRGLGLGLPGIVAVLTGDLSLEEAVTAERRAADAALAAPRVLAGREPAPGPALDLFVAAHAAGRRERDTPEFRRALLPAVATEQDPRVRRYWTLFGEVTGQPATAGSINSWLIDALERDVSGLA